VKMLQMLAVAAVEICLKKQFLSKESLRSKKQNDPLYEKLKNYHDLMRNTVSNTTTEKLSKEVMDVISNPDATSDSDRKYLWTKTEEEKLNELNIRCRLLEPREEWTWGAADDSCQGIYNKRMQLCIAKECQWRIIECPECLSTGILVGLDQID
jgi:hypothetical protein